ncbi:DNA polymerase kappa [Portunus trituberculatus]|uniref:DNA polymerase kappa n=1 Tax=Portunus trituberculatus TaxID=210409 RepID=A0A5B7J7Q1_PORTR|nr:DNA polymerase kappa [Portunus trituberculatus]
MAAGIKRLLLHEMNAATVQPLSLRLLGVRMSSLMFSSEVGQRRQATLTQMFSQTVQPKASSSTTFSHSEQESHQTQKEIVKENVRTKSDSTVERNSPVTAKTNISQKIDISIENFLSKPKPSKPTEEFTRTEVYECSVCEELVHVESLEEFNKHLDTCLEIHSSPSLRKSSIDSSNSKGDTGIRNNSEQSEESDQSSDDDEIPSDNSHLDNIDPTTSSLNQNLLCPVCEQRSFNDMTALNNHMDECLNKSAISELLQESNRQQEAARAQKTEMTKNQNRSDFI